MIEAMIAYTLIEQSSNSGLNTSALPLNEFNLYPCIDPKKTAGIQL